MRGEKRISLWGGIFAATFTLVGGSGTILFSDMLISETIARIGFVVGLVGMSLSAVMWLRAHFSPPEKPIVVPINEQEEYERRAALRRVEGRLEVDRLKNQGDLAVKLWQIYDAERNRQIAERLETPEDPT